MSERHWTDGQLLEVHSWREVGRSWSWIASKTGDHPETAKARYSKAKVRGLLDRVLASGPQLAPPVITPQGDSVAWQQDADGSAVVESPSSGRIVTLEHLLQAAAVDLTRWFVERWVCNKWEVGARGPDGLIVVEPLFQVKAWLKPFPGLEDARVAVAELIADMELHAPLYALPRYAPIAGERHLLEVCLMDLHIGMLSWGEETGADYDSDIARNLVREAVAALVGRASGFPIEGVLLPLGNDMTHADRTNVGAGGLTHAGTALDVDTRRARMVRMTRTVAVETIDALRQVAPVEVVIVPGNHDHETAFALGEVVHAWYRNDKAVSVRNEPAPRKYIRYGTTLLGFAHGHGEKLASLPLLMATEASSDWPAVTHREWHLGHLHRKGEAVEEVSGVRVRVMPSLAAEDAWHASKGFRHMRAAEAYLWSHDSGYVGHFSVGCPPQLTRAA